MRAPGAFCGAAAGNAPSDITPWIAIKLTSRSATSLHAPSAKYPLSRKAFDDAHACDALKCIAHFSTQHLPPVVELLLRMRSRVVDVTRRTLLHVGHISWRSVGICSGFQFRLRDLENLPCDCELGKQIVAKHGHIFAHGIYRCPSYDLTLRAKV